MDDSFIFFMIGTLNFVIGLPLFLQKIKRNGFYGFRVKKTLSDDKYWYPVNKASGKWFMISGIAIICASLILSSVGIEKASFSLIMIVIIVLGAVPPVLIPYRLLKTLQ